jgi:hypothetical protein
MNYCLIATAVLTIFSLAPVAFAQTPQPDRYGDYYNNEAPVKAVRSRGSREAGSLWQVVSAGLNCRSAPGTAQPIIQQFQRGDALQVEVYRGGADEVLLNAKDDNGRPWMLVRLAHAEACYVRANSRYIQPQAQ